MYQEQVLTTGHLQAKNRLQQLNLKTAKATSRYEKYI